MNRNVLLVILLFTFLASCKDNSKAPQPCVPQKQPEKLVSLTDSLAKTLDWPDDFKINVFSGPEVTPDPAVLAVAPTGEVYVGVDMNGSLDTKYGQGAIVRLADCNHDGIMDSHTLFAKVGDPRGIIAIGNDVYVLHTHYSKKTKKPTWERLVKFEDKDHDGVADGKPTVLVKHMGNHKYLAKRGTDHATNGIEMGIDGWIYIAAGDYGFYNAVGSDGTKLTMLGGGIVRVRPDGSEMEVYTHGLRNVYDMAINPLMDIFTRGNTNDGGGWNIRFIDQIQSGEYGYPMLFKHFTEEIIPALADLGGGSGTGALYMDDPRWPDKYNEVPMMADWGRSYLYIHRLTPDKGTFTQKQEKFIEIPQITGVDIDASGTLYMSAWAGAGYKGDPEKGFTVRAVPDGLQPKDFPDLQNASVDELIKYLKSESAKARLYAQYELLRRPEEEAVEAAWEVANNKQLPLDVRVAGLFTYAQIAGEDGIDHLVKLTHDSTVKEYALRALTDRKPYIDQVPIEPFLSALNSSSDRIKIAAIVGLGRLGRKKAVQPLLKKVSVPSSFKSVKPDEIGPHATPNPDIIPPHVTVQALLKIGATDALLDAVEKNHNKLALWALRYVHKPDVPKRLIRIYNNSDDPNFKQQLLRNLARIYHKEAPYKGTWWHTRPDTHGPYYNGIDWESTPLIRDFLVNQWQQSSAANKEFFAMLNSKYRLDISEFGGIERKEPKKKEAEKPSGLNLEKTGNKEGQIGKAPIEKVMLKLNDIKGEIALGKKLFARRGCQVCHNVKPSKVNKGPFLGQIGAIMNRRQIAKAILRPNATIAQGFSTVLIQTNDKSSYIGFVTEETASELVMRNATGRATTIKKSNIATRKELDYSIMPKGLVNSLTFKEFASLVDYLSKQKK